MPALATEPHVELAGDALRFVGALRREHVAAVWKQALPMLAAVRVFDLAQVDSLDSAGLACLAELGERAGHPRIDHAPAALDELRSAYRLTRELGFGIVSA